MPGWHNGTAPVSNQSQRFRISTSKPVSARISQFDSGSGRNFHFGKGKERVKV